MLRHALISLISLTALTLTACGKGDSVNSTPPGLSSGPRLPEPSPAPTETTTDPIIPEACAAVSLKPYPDFVSIHTLFPDPSALLTVPDTVSALVQLRSIASPTQSYHSELLTLVHSARRLDPAHLRLLVRASYFNASDLERIESDLSATDGLTDHASCVRRMSAARDLSILKGYAVYTQMILEDGLPKIDSLSWDDALELLEEVMPTDDGSKAFVFVAKKFAPLDELELQTLITLSSRKSASEAASRLAFEWYLRFSDRGFQAALETNAQLNGRAKDLFLERAIRTFTSLTVAQVKSLVRNSFGSSGKTAAAAFVKVTDFSHQAVLDVLTELDDEDRGEFLVRTIARYPSLQTEELITLLRSTKYHRSNIALAAVRRLSDVSVESILSVTPFLSRADKDAFLQSALDRLKRVSASEALRVIHEADDVRSAIAIALCKGDKISDLTVDDAVRIVGELDSADKDAFLQLAVDEVTDLTPESLEKLIGAGSEAGKDQIRTKGIERMGLPAEPPADRPADVPPNSPPNSPPDATPAPTPAPVAE